jgi:predicted nucleic acid-binding protein
MLKIYLDNCCYNRPFDDPTKGDNYWESVAMLFIKTLIKFDILELAYSQITIKEIDADKDDDRKRKILEYIFENAKYYIEIDEHNNFGELVAEIMETGIKVKDASHIASAILLNCDYFITTDKRLLKYKDDRIKVINPKHFAEIWSDKK